MKRYFHGRSRVEEVVRHREDSEDHITLRFNITALITGVICLCVGFGGGYMTASQEDPGSDARAECQKMAVATRDRCMNSGLSGLLNKKTTIEKCEEVYESDLARCGD